MQAAYWPTTRIGRKGRRNEVHIRQRRFLKEAVALLAVLFVGGLFYVWSRVQITQMGYSLQRATEQRERLLEEGRILKLEHETLRSPKRLESVAGELKLKKPGKEQIVYIP